MDDDDSEIERECIASTYQQTPAGVAVTLVNSSLAAIVLNGSHTTGAIVAWFVAALTLSATRLSVWWAYRNSRPVQWSNRRWSVLSVCVAFASGALWGAGSVLLPLPFGPDELFWALLIGGMSAGAAALHYPHLPTALAFIFPACLPLAIQFGLEDSPSRVVLAGMIGVFVIALTGTSYRSNKQFRENVRLRFDLRRRTDELHTAHEKLQAEVAEHQVTEAALRQVQKLEAIGQLAGGVAHDFNNLLFVVLGSLDRLRSSIIPTNTKALHLIDNAIGAAERGATLTQRLLAFGRRQTLSPEILDVNGAIQGVRALLKTSVGGQVSLSLQIPDTPSCITVDRNQFEIALLNLANNARDAMPKGGNIAISTRDILVRSEGESGVKPGRYVIISIADTGEGMDERTLNHAVEPFFTTKGVGKGTGLGLSMVHGFAAQSGGKLTLQSAKGAGTTVEMWFPLTATAGAVPDRAGAGCHRDP